jgi:hypothetical protein
MHKNKKTNLPTTNKREYGKLYMREWRLTHPYPDYYLANREQILNRQNKYHRTKRQQVLKVIGEKCIVCDTTKRLVFHEIHGKRHDENCRLNFYLAHPQDFITLCYYHHKFIHILVGLSPEQLKECLNISKQLLTENLPFYVYVEEHVLK